MTLIAVAEAEAEETKAERACTAVAVHHPSLVIAERDQASVKPERIDDSITAPEVASGSDSHMHYELVKLHVQGAAATHLAALVDPLLVSGVPTYLWWLGTPPFGSNELRDALQIADALVVDSARFTRPYHSFLALAGTSAHAHHRLGLADLQWARLDPWRETIAQFFAPVARRPYLSGITEIGIDYAGEGRGNRIPSSVLIGWMASAVGWKLQRATGGTGGVVSAQYEADRWRVVDVAFRSVTKAGLVEVPEAYERLLLDCMIGDPTLFTRADEVEAAWKLIDPIETAWRDDRPPLHTYESGTWGPPAAAKLLEADGREWHRP